MASIPGSVDPQVTDPWGRLSTGASILGAFILGAFILGASIIAFKVSKEGEENIEISIFEA